MCQLNKKLYNIYLKLFIETLNYSSHIEIHSLIENMNCGEDFGKLVRIFPNFNIINFILFKIINVFTILPI